MLGQLIGISNTNYSLPNKNMPIGTRTIGWTTGRLAWLFAGFFALAIGAIGALLPILPTTPFVILAAFCFGKSAPSFQRKLEQSHAFGPVIVDWRANGAITKRYKIVSVAMMAGVIALSIVTGFSTIVIAIQMVLVVAASSFILTRPNGRPSTSTATRAGHADLRDQFGSIFLTADTRTPKSSDN